MAKCSRSGYLSNTCIVSKAVTPTVSPVFFRPVSAKEVGERQRLPPMAIRLERRRRQLLINRVSNNVGRVKHFLGALVCALRRARHFALVEELPCQPRPARNPFSGQELSPTHASLRSQPRS